MASSKYDGHVRIDTRLDTDAFEQGIDEINKGLKNTDKSISNLSEDIKNMFSADFGKVKDEITNNTKSLDEQKKNVDGLNNAYKKTRDEAAEIAMEMERLESKSGNNERLSQINALKSSLKELQEKGFYFGNDEFDEAYIKLKELEKEVKIYRKDLDSTATNGIFSNKLTEELYEAKNALEALKNKGLSFGDDEFDEAYIKLKELENEVKIYKKELDNTATNSTFSSKLIEDLYEAKNTLESLKNQGLSFGDDDFDAAYSAYFQANNAVREYRKFLEAANSTSEESTESTSRLAYALNGAKKAFSTAGQVSKKVLSAMWSMAKRAFRAITGGSKSSKKGIDLMNTSLGKAITRIGRMAKTILVFRLFRTALTNLKNYFGDLIKSNEQFTNSLGRVKGNLRTAFMPVFDAIMPAVNALMSALVKLSGYLAQITTTIFGKSISASQKQAKALDAVSSSAKKANKALGKYDELNVISSDKDSSSGSSSGTIEPIYGDIETSDAISEYIKRLKEAFKNGDYEGVGAIIGESINNALESIDWNSIQSKAGKLTTNATRILNGLMQNVDFHLIGSTIGNGLNTAIEVAFSFVSTFDWKTAGKSVGDLINGLFDTVDWDKLSKSITKGIDGIFTTIDTALTTIDFSNIGWSFADIVNSLINVDWGQVATTISDCFSGMLDFIIAALSEIDWEQLGRDVVDFLCNIDWLTLLEKLGKILLLALWGIGNTILGALSEIGTKLWTVLKDTFGSIADWFKEKFDKAYENICKVFAGIGDWFKERWNDICTAFSNVGDWFKEKFNKAKDNIHSAFSGIGNWFRDRKNEITGFFSGIPDWFKTKFTNAFDNIKEVFSISKIKTHFTSIWTTITDVFKKVPEWFEDKFKTAWENVKNVFSKGSKVFSGMTDSIADQFKRIVNMLIDGINDVVAFPFNKINQMLNKIRNVSIMKLKPFKNLWSQDPISIPKIPRLATGAVIPPNKEFLAVLGDQRHGQNIEAPAELIKKMAKEAIDEAGGSGDCDVTVNVYLEGDAAGIVKLVKTEQIKESKRKPLNPKPVTL